MSSLEEALRQSFPDSTDCILLHVGRHPNTVGRSWHLNYGAIESHLILHPQVADSAVDLTQDIVYIALNGDYYSVDDLVQLDSEFRLIIDRCLNVAIG